MSLYTNGQIDGMALWLGQKRICYPLSITGGPGSGKTILARALAEVINGDALHTYTYHGLTLSHLNNLVMGVFGPGVKVLDNLGSLNVQQRDVLRLLARGEGVWKFTPSKGDDEVELPVMRVIPFITTSYSNAHSGPDLDKYLTPLPAIVMKRIPALSYSIEQLHVVAQEELRERLTPNIEEFRQEFFGYVSQDDQDGEAVSIV